MNPQPARATIVEYFHQWERSIPNSKFLRQPVEGSWTEYSWHEVGTKARSVLASLRSQGYQPGDRIAILSQNCAEWVICDLVILMGGFVSVPLYANVNAETMKAILAHAEAKLLFIGKLFQSDWDEVHLAIPSTVKAVSMNGYEKEGVTSWSEFLAGRPKDASGIALSGDDVVTIIYTSGTTGAPKGVVHTHRTIMGALEAAKSWVKLDRPGNRFISYLPLSHAAERGLVEFGAIFSGGSISFVESQETFADNIRESQPTHFFGVPRIWEKFQSKILEKMSQEKLDKLLAIPVIRSVVKSRIRKALGLSDADVILTGAAPVSADLLLWFTRIGIVIREAYGMSENFNVCAMNPPHDVRIGYVGKLFDNQEVVIDPDTREIKQRCNWVMKEYYKDPELTAQTLRDGFLHTGDMGEVDADNYLRLSGRVKDIFKTSKGEYIAPGEIEMKFLALKEVDQACVLGSLYPQPFILVGLSIVGKALDRSTVGQTLKSMLVEYNKDVMVYQKIKKVIVVKEEWTTANQLLTPTLKMKRNALASRYEARLAMYYESSEEISWES